jgi:hypothetical protein
MGVKMRVKTSELSGAALDWAVAKREGRDMVYFQVIDAFMPSTDWAHGGPIIEREKIDVLHYADGGWLAVGIWLCEAEGQTPLIAAMRCYVASKFGDEVEIPEELTLKEFI